MKIFSFLEAYAYLFLSFSSDLSSSLPLGSCCCYQKKTAKIAAAVRAASDTYFPGLCYTKYVKLCASAACEQDK